MASVPPNVHVSSHPCLLAKLSQLRSKSVSARDVKSLIHELSIIVSCEALASSIAAVDGPKAETPLGFEFTTKTVQPSTMCIVPILRSGLGMVEGVQTVLPNPVPVHHLGMYREPSTLDPVEYYNNLPHHIPEDPSSVSNASSLAILVDPVIATGGTCSAAIQTLREWGVKRIIVLGIVAADAGLQRVAAEWPEGTEIWIAGVDQELTQAGMLKPGLGDVGDRLFLTIGK
ncbi:uracil phosphoribosyltransferase-domain-containing protein [Dactylonectria macrodidyma]|uniref:uracil phosphoribosyltransferase n=1 Tax=Dactylonectria macrodidyma TaxID=307937 RepID=A0A9P9EM75_9HYPO|nr:uracil phosphoribosyltransferase-domain-containing protein [Dactylonectria macrodidyma]